ncbi:MAG: LysR family transcriptional regulator [Minwuia sp.]|uniref:LysR family transcriptional regulator n=1 Tax=Minwuia sp. TaxID=2493630 RepID=UPI003A86A30A
MQDLTAMAVFAAVAEAMSFSQAADRLGLSKSAVSKQLARLEERLGARLVNRSTRQISLTEAGETYYGYCARMLAEAEAAEEAVQQLQGDPRGRLKVNAPMSFGTMHLAEAVAAFMCEYQDVTVDLDLTDSFVDLIDQGVDVAIRITELADSSLIARKLAPARNLVLASPAYLEKSGTPAHPSELKNHRMLIYSNATETSTMTFRRGGEVVPVSVNGPLRSNNGEILRDAAVAGRGLTITPTFLAHEQIRDGRLVPVLSDWMATGRGIHAVYPHRKHLSPKVRAFIDFLAGYFGDPPYWEKGLP